jgi:DNA-binding HxlR family transcriptional regulator
MALGTSYAMADCAVAQTLDIVGERWTLLIVSYLFFGLRRYSDVRKRLGISPAVLTQRLGRLVDEGIVTRVPGAGAHEEYELTAKGQTLWPIVSGLVQWGNANSVDAEYRHEFTHYQCGTALDATGFCPECAIVPPARDVVRHPCAAELEPGPATPRAPRRLVADSATA